MKAILISDLHLEEQRQDITDAFLLFCKEKVQNIDHFFILGDFFEVWIGDDFESPFIKTIKEALQTVSSRVKHCYFQHGNRDFLIGQTFAEQTGFKLIDEQHAFTLGQTRYLLMHGDSLCTRDTDYMQARQLLRSEAFQKDVLSKSIDERLALAQQLRSMSMEAGADKAMDIMDVTPDEVIKLMEATHTDVLIHGHTHRPAVHELDLKHNANAKRIVMSDWEAQVQYVSIDKENGAQLLSFN